MRSLQGRHEFSQLGQIHARTVDRGFERRSFRFAERMSIARSSALTIALITRRTERSSSFAGE
jgi:hypothetical protein